MLGVDYDKPRTERTQCLSSKYRFPIWQNLIMAVRNAIYIHNIGNCQNSGKISQNSRRQEESVNVKRCWRSETITTIMVFVAGNWHFPRQFYLRVLANIDSRLYSIKCDVLVNQILFSDFCKILYHKSLLNETQLEVLSTYRKPIPVIRFNCLKSTTT